MTDPDPTGGFLWHELLTTEPEEAEAFYTALVGWTAEPWEGAETPYTLFHSDEGPVAGMMGLPSDAQEGGAQPHWLSYVGTSDVDATVDRAADLGAEVLVSPTEIPDAGRFAVLVDPQGAVFATYTPATPSDAGTDDEPTPGSFSWHELATTDYEEALSFYGELFGWEAGDAEDMGEAGLYQMYGLGGRPLGGMYDLPGDQGRVPSWMAYVTVADVQEAAETITELGGDVVNGPMEVPGGDWIVHAIDPQGAVFALHAPAGEGG